MTQKPLSKKVKQSIVCPVCQKELPQENFVVHMENHDLVKQQTISNCCGSDMKVFFPGTLDQVVCNKCHKPCVAVSDHKQQTISESNWEKGEVGIETKLRHILYLQHANGGDKYPMAGERTEELVKALMEIVEQEKQKSFEEGRGDVVKEIVKNLDFYEYKGNIRKIELTEFLQSLLKQK